MYFEEKGPANTAKVVELVAKRAKELGIKHVVVASNTGATAEQFLSRDYQLVCVTHHVGYREPGDDEMPAEMRQKLAAAGVKVLTTTQLFANVERALSRKFGGAYPTEIIAETLRCFGHGTKVAAEIATMALDAGMIPHGEEIIAVGGSTRGCDTALVLKPAHAKDFFDLEVCEVICKPRYH